VAGGVLALGLGGLSSALLRPPTAPASGRQGAAASTGARREVDSPAGDPWLEEVAALPPANQVEAVATRLRKRNPGFVGQVKPAIRDGAVVELTFPSNGVKDLAPLRALKGLKRLHCPGVGGKGDLSDLSPLQGMSLTFLDCSDSRVQDLTPLKGMSLGSLSCSRTNVSDLTPLAGMKTLKSLACASTRVSDFSPLKGLPLQTLTCDCIPWRGDAEPLRALKTLQTINGKPAAAYWNDVDLRQAAFRAWLETQPPEVRTWAEQVAALPPDEQVEAVARKLQERNPGFGGKVKPTVADGLVTGLAFVTVNVTEVAPVRALPGLRDLSCTGGAAGNGKLADLSPLAGLPLATLNCSGTQVSDLAPLCGMPLKSFTCTGTRVSDLSPLAGAPLVQLTGDLRPERDAPALRSIKTLQTINGKPAAEFWKGLDTPPSGR
jgi:Leucine-rich repeat (LRR) protein